MVNEKVRERYPRPSKNAIQQALAADVLPRCLLGALNERAAEGQRWPAIGVLKEANDETSTYPESRGNLPIGFSRDSSLQAQRSRRALPKCGIPALVR
jgi:hypothetical protein